MSQDVVIVSAVRTAVGAFGGGLSTLPASELGRVAIVEALQRAGVAAEEVSEVIMGQVLTAGSGQNPARQAAIAAGIPASSSAVTINQVCGSGVRSLAMAYQALVAGDSAIVVFPAMRRLFQIREITGDPTAPVKTGG